MNRHKIWPFRKTSLPVRSRGRSSALIVSLAIMAFAAASHAEDKLSFNIYGAVKLDAIYDSAAMKYGDAGVSVIPQPANGNDTSETIMTANQSKIGVNITAPSIGNAEVTGKIEMDFFNPVNGPDYRAAPMMRLAYLNMDWAESKFSILAGQNWDLMEALRPTVLNYDTLYGQGNLGYRHPQIRLTKAFDVANSEFKVEAAVVRAISDSGLNGSISSNDAGSPALQARLSFTTALLTEKKTTIGFSGSKSNPKVFKGTTGGGPTDDGLYATGNEWSTGLDLNMPITDGLTLAGSYYRGQDLKSYFGLSNAVYASGISQTENGGWIQLSYRLSDSLQSIIGYGYAQIEDVQDVATPAAGSYNPVKNTVPYVELRYEFTKMLSAGVEVAQYTTTYSDQTSNMSNRYQLSMMLGF